MFGGEGCVHGRGGHDGFTQVYLPPDSSRCVQQTCTFSYSNHTTIKWFKNYFVITLTVVWAFPQHFGYWSSAGMEKLTV